jgi:hypothetical protein
MTARRLAALAIAGAITLLLGSAVAQAAENDTDTHGYPSTQSPTQGVTAVVATVQTLSACFLDAVNGDDRPEGANGTECEFQQADPRYVEGPAGGLVKDGPFE